MNRREALLSTSAMAVSASLGAIACGAQNAVAQAGAAATGGAPGENNALLDAVYDCRRKGEACIVHCHRLLATGDATMGGCVAAAHDMLAAMDALAAIAAAGGKRTTAFAKAAAEFCRDCETECRKHAHHSVCHECADACAKTLAAVAKLG